MVGLCEGSKSVFVLTGSGGSERALLLHFALPGTAGRVSDIVSKQGSHARQTAHTLNRLCVCVCFLLCEL